MKTFSCKVHSFEDMAVVLGIKVPGAKAPKGRKCPNCGEELTFHEGTNVWTCGNPFIRDEKLGDQDVQVFGTCDYFALD